jgi:hypothetical protein
MSIIAAGTTTTTALSSTGNTDGTIQLQVNGTTPSVTLNALGAVGVGASPNFGTSGQALVSAGSTAAPAWGNVQAPLVSGTNIKTINGGSVLGSGDLTVGGGSLIFLSEVVASNSATVDVETTFSSTYDAYLLVGTGVRPDTNGTTLRARMKLGGAYDTGNNYLWHLDHSQSQSGAYNAQGSSTTPLSYILLAWSVGNATTDSVNFTMHINNPSSTAFAKHIYWEGSTYRVGSSNIQVGTGVGSNTATTALTGIRFFPASGLLVEGRFRLYGIKNN